MHWLLVLLYLELKIMLKVPKIIFCELRYTATSVNSYDFDDFPGFNSLVAIKGIKTSKRPEAVAV